MGKCSFVSAVIVVTQKRKRKQRASKEGTKNVQYRGWSFSYAFYTHENFSNLKGFLLCDMKIKSRHLAMWLILRVVRSDIISTPTITRIKTCPTTDLECRAQRHTSCLFNMMSKKKMMKQIKQHPGNTRCLH